MPGVLKGQGHVLTECILCLSLWRIHLWSYARLGRGAWDVLGFRMLPSPSWFSSLGFVTDGNSKLVGSAHLRQVRVRESSCAVAWQLQGSFDGCRAPYSLDAEDLADYGEGWNASAHNSSDGFPKVWQYQSQSRRRGYPTWGKLTVYRGGGYVVPLGTDHQSASR